MLYRFVRGSFSQRLDLKLGGCCDAEALGYRKEAAQNTSQPIVNWRMRFTLNTAGGNICGGCCPALRNLANGLMPMLTRAKPTLKSFTKF